jgi:hypothetical protein
MLPVVHGLENEYWNKIDFVYLDHLDPINQQVMTQYNFLWRPLFILVNPDGSEVQRWFGYVDADSFREAFDNLLAQS